MSIRNPSEIEKTRRAMMEALEKLDALELHQEGALLDMALQCLDRRYPPHGIVPQGDWPSV